MPYLFSLLLLIAPLYVWRFSIGGLPVNFLMLANFAVIIIGLILIAREKKWQFLKESMTCLGKPLLVVIALFGFASLLSLFIFGLNTQKLAQWIVLYAQPMTLFVLFRYFSAQDERVYIYFKTAVYIVVGAAGALAIVQYFTLFALPQAWWGNDAEPKRAIAFFAHANAYALFATPLLAWLIPDAVQKLRQAAARFKNYAYVGAWIIGALGLFLSLSRGAWLGLFLAAGLYVLLTANKKMMIGFAIAGLLLAGVVVATPNLRYRVLLPFQGEKSAVARLSLWDTAGKMISDSPLLGKGINGFSDNWERYNTDPNLEHYNFPHNIFLNFWVDLGLLGMISFTVIVLLAFVKGIIALYTDRPALFRLTLFIVALVAHGLIDIPYLKNDLALLFWLVLAASV